MTLTQFIQTTPLQFLVDETGTKKAVLVDFALWQEILTTLEQLETPTTARSTTLAPTLRAIRGKYAFVPTSSDQFARRKQEEIDLEG